MSKKEKNITDEITLKNSIFKIGRVFSVDGLEVKIKVDKRKNSSHLLYKGTLLKNISVGGYLKIVKGFTSIIGKVSGEYIREEKYYNAEYKKEEDKIDRVLKVNLFGFIENGKFERGIKELPLIENHCFLLDELEFSIVHDFIGRNDEPIKIGTLSLEKGQDIKIGVNSVFASHIGIFGNTGSGKSYTLANLYRKLFVDFEENEKFKANAKFVLLDFNGEYNGESVIINNKKVYNLSTRNESKRLKDKIPFQEEDFLNIELFSIMANATEKTQEPFLKRSIDLYKYVNEKGNPLNYFRGILKNKLLDVICMKDNVKSHLLLDYFRALLLADKAIDNTITDDIDFHTKENSGWKIKGTNKFFSTENDYIEEIKLYQVIEEYEFPKIFISKIIAYLYTQLIIDVLDNRAQNEHISPAISKLKAFQRDFDEVFDLNGTHDFWDNNFFVVVNLDKTNLKMKKLVPLLLSHKLYIEHKNKKKKDPSKSLNIIIDEAHNILSYASQRESETWKDYRLETFEEIIKEGRKFGVFLTVASQRPSDISATIISQLHNYFIHRLINERDIEAVGKTISYLDKVSHDSLPILPVGTCVLAGLAAHVPVIIDVDPIIPKIHEPDNKTINLLKNWKDDEPTKDIIEN